jgi:hypothetical protein
MCREFEEEAGSAGFGWQHYASIGGPEARVPGLSGSDFRVWFFRAFTNKDLRDLVRSVTDEEIHVVSISTITVANAIPNLTWLIPMALTIGHDTTAKFEITEVPAA